MLFVSGLIFAGSVPGRVIDRAIAVGTLVATHATLDGVDRDPSWRRDSIALPRGLPARPHWIGCCQFSTSWSRSESFEHAAIPRMTSFLKQRSTADADAIVTGDKDLLVLHPFAGVAILTPADYLARARG